ncbi:MAG: AmmeMemoRadiSam system protein B [Magnetococcales bacterium]|nr:AmmeMemoRadiSam system protein B [Magnetococcales bacterium]
MFRQSTIRSPAVAGTFYPGEKGALRQMVQMLLERAPDEDLPAPCALVAPHAGYVYSGYTAACAYKSLKSMKQKGEGSGDKSQRVFLVGPSHRVYLEGVSVGGFSSFSTPLGDIPLDQTLIEKMVGSESDISTENAPHLQEHSLEVHLPFIQEILGATLLVPMVYGKVSAKRIAHILGQYAGPDDLIIVSSDLSHFYTEEQANTLDAQCHTAMKSGDAETMESLHACGNTGMAALLELAKKKGWKNDLVDYRTSAETSGDRSSVVGYASYLFRPE